MPKRISFSKEDASHIHELCLENFQELCGECESIKARLEKFIGKDETEINKIVVDKYPYGR